MQDLQKLYMYNNVKYRELKQGQVTYSFSSPRTPGQSTQCGQGLPYRPPCSLAQLGPVLWSEGVSSKLNCNAAWLPEGWPSGGLVSLTLKRGLTR